jgi:hypothetical protein
MRLCGFAERRPAAAMMLPAVPHNLSSAEQLPSPSPRNARATAQSKLNGFAFMLPTLGRGPLLFKI